MTSRAWSAEETKEALPELWHISSSDYKNRVKKTAAVESMAKQFNTSAPEISRKLHNLRTQFNNEVRKIKKKKSGQGADDNYESTWEYFPSFKFLSQSSHTTSETRGSLEVAYYTISDESQASTRITSNLSQSSQRTSKKRKKEDEVLELAMAVLEKPEDDAASFGNFVAAAIRNLRSDIHKRELKRKIQRVILDLEEQDESDHYAPSSTPRASMPNTSWENTLEELSYQDL